MHASLHALGVTWTMSIGTSTHVGQCVYDAHVCAQIADKYITIAKKKHVHNATFVIINAVNAAYVVHIICIIMLRLASFA